LDPSGGSGEKPWFRRIGTPGHIRFGGLQKMNKSSAKGEMTTLVIDESSLRAVRTQLTYEALVVDLADGRTVSVPLVWYPRLLLASMEERQQFRLIGNGEGIHWELLDEDVSVEGIVAGRRSTASAESLKRGQKSTGLPLADRVLVLAANRLCRPGSEHALAQWLERILSVDVMERGFCLGGNSRVEYG
jgi:Protein of unknown function (DUF2442)